MDILSFKKFGTLESVVPGLRETLSKEYFLLRQISMKKTNTTLRLSKTNPTSIILEVQDKITYPTTSYIMNYIDEYLG